MRTRILASLALTVSLVAGAAMAATMTAQDKKALAQLTPDLRKEVISRLTPGETVRGVLEVMLLNRLSLLSSEGYKEVIVEHDRGTGVVTYPNGKKEPFKFDVTTYELIK